MQKFFRYCENVRMGIADLCKFKSSQRDISRPVGRFLEIFYSKSRGFDCWCLEV